MPTARHACASHLIVHRPPHRCRCRRRSVERWRWRWAPWPEGDHWHQNLAGGSTVRGWARPRWGDSPTYHASEAHLKRVYPLTW